MAALSQQTAEDLKLALESCERRRIEAARRNVNAFIEYAGRYKDKQRPDGTKIADWERLVQYPVHEQFQERMDQHRFLVLMAAPEAGKAVPLDTPIPVPGGMRLMGELAEGDLVFDRHGKPCRVTWTSPVQHGRRVYEIVFDEGSSALADADHQWWASQGNGEPLEVVTTQHIVDGGIYRHGKRRWRMPIPGAVEHPERDLPIHPYVLGVWLGNPRRKRAPNRLRLRLRNLGLLGDKHIPEAYQAGSPKQRLELLAGLLDTDGWVADPDKRPNRIQFSSSVKRLAGDVLRLVRSLGIKARLTSKRAKLNGDLHRTAYMVTFTTDRAVFRLRRKLERQVANRPTRNGQWRFVASIREVESCPVRCIQVDSPDCSYLMGHDYLVTHNTTNIVLRLVWMLGHNPNLQFALVSRTAKPGSTAAKMARQIKQYIKYSPEVRKVFPELRPGPKWEETTFIVQRTSYSGDPTVQILGAFGTITGSRVDGIVLDDVYNAENTKTEHERTSMLKWIRGSLVDRLSATGFMWMSCNAWHPRDPAHELEKDSTSAFVVCRFPIHDPVTGENVLPQIWPEERLETQRAAMGDLEYARAFDLKARDDGESPFREADVDAAFDPGCEAVYELKEQDFDPKMHVVAAIDPAHTDGPKANWTAISVMAFWDGDPVRQLFWIVGGKWQPDQTAAVILDIQQRFHPDIFVVENNGAQRWMKQIVELYVENERLKAKLKRRQFRVEMPNILPLMTGKKKNDPTVGIESLSVELSARRWMFPDYRVEGPCRKDLVRLRDDILFYARGAHTGDHLMSLHLGREGCRYLGFRERGRRDEDAEGRHDEHQDQQSEPASTPRSTVPVMLDLDVVG